MMCCILVGMLLAQITARLRRASAWLSALLPLPRRGYDQNPNPGIQSVRAVAMACSAFLLLGALLTHWEHLEGEAQATMATVGLILQPSQICSSTPVPSPAKTRQVLARLWHGSVG